MKNHNVLLIKDLARTTGLSVYTIKYYLKLGLISETDRTPETNFRLFDQSTVQRLQKIRQWRRQGVSLKQIIPRLATPEATS